MLRRDWKRGARSALSAYLLNPLVLCGTYEARENQPKKAEASVGATYIRACVFAPRVRWRLREHTHPPTHPLASRCLSDVPANEQPGLCA